ncbi:MAG: hypothetical protein ACHQAX_09300 [Gammaproteobacteria bacterium]
MRKYVVLIICLFASWQVLSAGTNGSKSSEAHIVELVQLSQETGVSIETLDMWGKAIENFGESAVAFQHSVQSFAKKKNATPDVIFQYLPILADEFQKVGKKIALDFGKESLGLDVGTIDFLLQGRKAVEKALADQKDRGVITETDPRVIKIIEKFKNLELQDWLNIPSNSSPDTTTKDKSTEVVLSPEWQALKDRADAVKDGRAVPEVKFGNVILPAVSEADSQRYKFEGRARGLTTIYGTKNLLKPDQAFLACLDAAKDWIADPNAEFDERGYNYAGRRANGDGVVDIFIRSHNPYNQIIDSVIRCVVKINGDNARVIEIFQHTDVSEILKNNKNLAVVCDIDNANCTYVDKNSIKDNKNLTIVCDMAGGNCRHVDKQNVRLKCGPNIDNMSGTYSGVKYNLYTGHCLYL